MAENKTLRLNKVLRELNISLDRAVEHLAGKGTIAEVITEDIIRDQTLLVDDISGATTSSHVLKLAIQDALEEE